MDMQNVSSLQIPEGIVRTIHDKDDRLLWGRVAYNTKYAGYSIQNGTPTPGAPVPVQTVTGEQTVKVSGKNLFDGILELGIIYGKAGDDGISNSYICGKDYIPVKELTNYKFSTDNANIISVFVYEYKADKSYNLTTNKNINLGSYLTTDANTAYIRFRPSYKTTDTSIKFQVEEGTVATAYEPYTSQSYPISLGSIELCKIGNYQDYIYKSGDGWYVHKEVSKQVLDGTENIYNKDTSSGFTRIFFSLTGQVNVGNNRSTNLRSDYFNASDVNNYGTAFLNNARALVYPQSTITTVEEFKTWLSSHNTTVYYPIATPTDTKITDATLVAQLNDVHEWLTRYGYNATVSGDLPIVLQRDSLQ